MAKEMDINTQSAVRKIVKENVREVLKRYFTEDIVRKITNEIMPGVEWDLGNMDMEEAVK